MRPNSRIAQHMQLCRTMARRSGADLSEALHRRALSAADFAGLVTRCRHCPAGAEACQAALADRAAPATPPEFCPNREVLLGLAARMA